MTRTESELETTKEIFTVSEAAQFLEISERTLRRLIAERRVPFAKVGNSLRLRRTALLKWLEREEERNFQSGHRETGSQGESPDLAERAARIRAARGALAHVPLTVDEVIEWKRREVQRENERWTELTKTNAEAEGPTG